MATQTRPHINVPDLFREPLAAEFAKVVLGEEASFHAGDEDVREVAFRDMDRIIDSEAFQQMLRSYVAVFEAHALRSVATVLKNRSAHKPFATVPVRDVVTLLESTADSIVN